MSSALQDLKRVRAEAVRDRQELARRLASKTVRDVDEMQRLVLAQHVIQALDAALEHERASQSQSVFSSELPG